MILYITVNVKEGSKVNWVIRGDKYDKENN